MGLTLGSIFSLQARARASAGGTGFGKAKHIVMVYMQGGPSHLDLWDPKENLPDKMRSPFKSIPTRIPGIHFTEVLPELAKRRPGAFELVDLAARVCPGGEFHAEVEGVADARPDGVHFSLQAADRLATFLGPLALRAPK